jgi:hypothetical protein
VVEVVVDKRKETRSSKLAKMAPSTGQRRPQQSKFPQPQRFSLLQKTSKFSLSAVHDSGRAYVNFGII